MRIAIAATEMSDNGAVCSRGARAAFFLVFNEDAEVIEALENPFKDYDHAVGLHVADYLASKQVDIVAAGHIGSGFANALDNKGLRHMEVQGPIKDAVQAAIGQVSMG
jgi:predicted Fe-Mo cluster-binding NifX family protein